LKTTNGKLRHLGILALVIGSLTVSLLLIIFILALVLGVD
jgi:hypothetical protein